MDITKLSPLNTDYKIKIEGKVFHSPLHYLYYYTYTKNEQEKEKILKTTSVDVLLSYEYQLREQQITIPEINKHVYTLITYLYCMYPEFRKTICQIQKYFISFKIVNDSYYGLPDNKFGKSLKSFNKCLDISEIRSQLEDT